jgi:hypothetical protein
MIKIEVTGDSVPEVADKLLALGRSLSGANDPIMVEVKAAAKRTPAKKVEVKEAGAGAPAPEPEAQPAPEPEVPVEPAAQTGSAPDAPSEAPEALDFDKDVAPVVISFVQSKGKPYVVDILTEFGVTKASELPEDRWAELLTALRG